ncbi:MAG: tRNA (adenosine(37)-N6)-dimethylallyltransferase MiaA, partial [Christensenellales bacterium]
MYIVIGGATASGKSKLAVETAKLLKGEVISADSMQIYKKMDIGTAKIGSNEMQGIPHHLLDIVDPEQNFSTAQYARLAKDTAIEIENRGNVPIICGGTGLYINSLIYDYNLSAYDPKLRENLNAELEEKGIDYMYEKLLKIDPLAKNIHKNNVKRVIRALEVMLTEGKSILSKTDKTNLTRHLIYAVDVPRDELYERINLRVDEMFSSGLVEEVRNLVYNYGLKFDMQSMQAIGYKEFKGYFDREYDEPTLKELIKQHSRNYAKRRITWFKR